jgi:type IX secretion system PorP/SprF family membrane protein
MKHFLFFLIFLVFFLQANAQQDPQFTQFFTNQLFFNPAAAGAEQNTHVAGAFRNQWTGFNGAPLTFSLTGDHYFKKIRSAFGLITVYDTIGFEKTLDVKIAYAYRIPIKKTFLQLGVDMGTKTHTFDGVFIAIQPGDPNIPIGKQTATTFVISGGVYFWSKRFSVGLSVHNINRPTIFKDQPGDGYTFSRHYYLYLQYRQPLGEDFSLRPTFLVKSDAASTQLDADLLFYYQDRCFLGGAYRIDDAVAIMAGARIWKIWLQYSYDITTSKLGGYSNGSHEAMIRYSLPYKKEE